MKKIFTFSAFLIICSLESSLAQVNRIDKLVSDISQSFEASDFQVARKSLLQLLDPELKTPKNYLPYIYTNLGVTSSCLGKYRDAISYYNLSESVISTEYDSVNYLGEIYINKGIILEYNKSFREAIDYLEKGIRLNEKYAVRKATALSNISVGYQNLGVAYYEMRDYDKALEYSEKSRLLKIKNDPDGLPLVYFITAKCHARKGNIKAAEEYFHKSISLMKARYGADYIRLPEIYFEYSQLLYSLNRKTESFGLLQKSAEIYLKKYGEKYTLTSYSYKLTGDYYIKEAAFDSALFYYQKALISIVDDFNETDINANPSCKTSFYDIRLLDVLKSKAHALKLKASTQNEKAARIKTLENSLASISLTLVVIDRITGGFTDEESRMYIAGNEKETLISAIGIAGDIYGLTGKTDLVDKMYSFSQKAKASVLQNEISENNILHSPAVPDSLSKKLSVLSSNIEGYNRRIDEEMDKTRRDTNRISGLKDELFSMKREAGETLAEIISIFPEYQKLLAKTRPLSIPEIQVKLPKGQTIIDYSLSAVYEEGRRKLCIFIISHDTINFVATEVDSVFSHNAELIRNFNTPAAAVAFTPESSKNYNEALFSMFTTLFEPAVKYVHGNRIIIIPDEEIAYLPFEAFLTRMTDGKNSSLSHSYLLNDYSFSYAYSSSLIFGGGDKPVKGMEVFAFSPDYGNGFPGSDGDGKLFGADNESASIFKIFGGRNFTGSSATESNFRRVADNEAIFHFAMHTVPDASNSKFSYLLFDSQSDTACDGRLFNYEISQLRIKSPMVVLSACNSGTGTLYHGEGLMSLARGFILAGASSVIRTSWEVNDQTSSVIMGSFYKYLSQGMAKDQAMRQARLDYIRKSPPTYASPYYWAAYEVLGDTSPVAERKHTMLIMLIIAAALTLTGLRLYLRRRRIFTERLP